MTATTVSAGCDRARTFVRRGSCPPPSWCRWWTGRLGRRTTGTGFQVTPVVGVVRPPFDLAPDPGEVDTIFEVPLSFVLDSANHKTETRLIQGLEREFYVMPYGEFYIWGLTARLLVALRNTLGAT